MSIEGEIRRAQESYVQDLIGVEQLESRVWDALTGVWSPNTFASSAILKEVWSEPVTDAPGQIMVYRGQYGSGAYTREYMGARLDAVSNDEAHARVQVAVAAFGMALTFVFAVAAVIASVL